MEIWKDIKGQEGVYQVSNLGRVKSLEKICYSKKGKKFIRKELIMKLAINTSGYQQCNINKLTQRVHRLVCIAFLPNDENKPSVNHINGIKTDNRLENLEWCTAKENSIHAHLTNLVSMNGEMHHNAKLTDAIARKIKYEHKEISSYRLSKIYSICKKTVLGIRKGTCWKHI